MPPGDRPVPAGRTAESAQEEGFRLLVESVKDYAIFMLDPGGHVATWNAGAERIKGYKADEIIGKHFSIFYPPEDVAAGKPERELEIAAREGRFEDEGWRVRKDGSRFWANVIITALRDPQGDLVGFAKVTRDLTERRQAEETRRALAAEQAALAEKAAHPGISGALPGDPGPRPAKSAGFDRHGGGRPAAAVDGPGAIRDRRSNPHELTANVTNDRADPRPDADAARRRTRVESANPWICATRIARVVEELRAAHPSRSDRAWNRPSLPGKWDKIASSRCSRTSSAMRSSTAIRQSR